MKREIVVAAILVSFLVGMLGVGFNLVRVQASDGQGCEPKIVDLVAGQHLDVGSVTVWNDADYLYVEYCTTSGWVMTETHLAVADSLDGLPQTTEGNLIPGNFPYAAEHDPPVSEYTYEINLDEAGVEAGTELYVAAQAVVMDGSATLQWATHVEDHNQGTLVTGDPVIDPARTDPANALGAPDGSFYSLGFVSDGDGYLVLSFDEKVYNTPGYDIVIFEATFGRDLYPDEVADVYVIAKGVEYYAGTVTNHDDDGMGTVSIPEFLSSVDAVKLVDNTAPEDFEGSEPLADGYDVDAVGVCTRAQTGCGECSSWGTYFTYTVC